MRIGCPESGIRLRSEMGREKVRESKSNRRWPHCREWLEVASWLIEKPLLLIRDGSVCVREYSPMSIQYTVIPEAITRIARYDGESHEH